MEKKVTIGTVCFLFDEKHEKVLLLHRARNPMKGLITGVGGKTEFHEDIRESCKREVFEETGLSVQDLRLKGILKTIMDDSSSSWLLFVYTGEAHGEVVETDEGVLEWVPIHEIDNRNLIGFIRKILPSVLNEESFFEGTIVHDAQGNVVSSA